MAEAVVLDELHQTPPTDGDDGSLGLSSGASSPMRLAMRRFLRHRAAVAGSVLLLSVTIVCAFAPLFSRFGENERVGDSGKNFLAPSGEFWFGTDDIGRDLFSRIIWGGRVSILIGISVAIVAGVVGSLIGALSGFRGGRIDDFLMRITDTFLAIPLLVVLLIVLQLPNQVPMVETLMGPTGSMRLMISIISLVVWMPTARLVRGIVLSLKEKEFIEAARAMGASDWRIITRHLIPNALGPIIVAMTFIVATAIGLESTLSYFGFGLDPTKVSWGLLLSNSKSYITSEKWWLVLFPSIALLLTVLAVNFVGDGLRDAFDPKQQREH